MKTTIDIADALLDQARERAAADGTTLRAVVEAGLRRLLDEDRPAAFEFRDKSFAGDGLRAEFADAGWDRIRQEAYWERGG